MAEAKRPSRIDVHHHFFAPEYLAVMGDMAKRPVVRDWTAARSLEEMDKNGVGAVTPETFTDFVDLVVPELQRRGRYKLDYGSGTLREKLYGPGRARLSSDHPAARFRGAADQPGSR